MSIDIHNNTGKNPHYACVNKIEKNFLFLANLFSTNIVYFIKPEGVQSMAFAKLCPAITVECGLSGEKAGIDHVTELLLTCLNLKEFPQQANIDLHAGLFHTIAIAKIPIQYELAVGNPCYDISLNRDIEKFNFLTLSAGTIIGSVGKGITKPILVIAENGDDVTDSYLEILENKITIKKNIVPAMLTLDINTIKKDVLCYFMEKLTAPDLMC